MERQFKPLGKPEHACLSGFDPGDVSVRSDDPLWQAVDEPLDWCASAGYPDIVASWREFSILAGRARQFTGVLQLHCSQDALNVVGMYPGQPLGVTVAYIGVGVQAAQQPPSSRMVDRSGFEVGIEDALAGAFQCHFPAGLALVEGSFDLTGCADVFADTP